MNPFLTSMDRRRFLATGVALAGAAAVRSRAAVPRNAAWAGEVGITTSSVFRQMTKGATDRYFDLFELPKVMRDELGMKIIDINTGTLDTRDPALLDRFRKAVEDAGCVVTNLKVNMTKLGIKLQEEMPIEHTDAPIRAKAIEGYREWIVAAHRIGARWLRPIASLQRPDMTPLIESLAKLADLTDPLGMTIVLENGGWIQSDPDAIPGLVKALRGRIAATPDIGSWEKSVLEAGLTRAFPHAVSCDFKVGKLGPAGEHAAYDLRRCFELGWQAGFRGPWCIEHGGGNTQELFRELRWIRDQLKQWMREAGAARS